MKKYLFSFFSVITVIFILANATTSLALPVEKPGGVWHFMWSDQWGNDNYQCQPAQQNPECWPVWSWRTEPGSNN